MDGNVVSARALIESVAEQAPDQDPLTLLETAMRHASLAGEAADAMVDHYVAAARAADVSWTEIGGRIGISKQAARQRFSSRLGVTGEGGAGIAGGEPPALAPRLLACVEEAKAEAQSDGTAAGTQHLLLGLLHVGVAANVLDRLGVTRERVREAITRLLDHDGDRVVGDGEAETAVTSARRFASSRGQNLTRTEHLLFVLAMDAGCSARRILDDLKVEPARVKKELADVLPPPPKPRRRGRKTAAGKYAAHAGACSFCGCADDRIIVHGPGVRICADCVELASEIVETTRQQA